VEILSRAFYAHQDTRTPVIVGALAMGLNIVFSFLFSNIFSRIGWMPHGGLALANSLATGLESIALIMLMQKRLNGIDGAHIWKGVGVAVLGSGLMAAVILGWQSLVGGGSSVLGVLGGLGLGLGVYVGLMWIMKMPEMLGMVKMVISRIQKR
jgi:putative peptidoglycan lipid II flippase